jgi:hypothetical protein
MAAVLGLAMLMAVVIVPTVASARIEPTTEQSLSPNVSLSDQCAAGGGWHDTFAPDATYPERRIPLEAQEWFLPLGAQPGRSTGHTHLETCAPVGAVTGQDMRLDLRLRLHLGANIPVVDPSTVVKIDEIEIRGRNSYGRDVLVDQFILGGGRSFLTCTAGNLCETTIHFDGRSLSESGGPLIDLHDSPRIPRDAFYQHGFTTLGMNKQLRITAFGGISVNGKEVMRARAGLRVPIDLTTCIQEPGFSCSAPWQNYTDNTESVGWFGSGRNKPGAYGTVLYGEPIPNDAFGPTDTWNLPLILRSDTCGSCSMKTVPIVGYDIFLDPSFHTGPATPVVTRSFAPRTADLVVTEPVSWSNLAPGLHRFVIIVRQPVTQGDIGYLSTNHGIMVLPFVVAPDDDPYASGSSVSEVAVSPMPGVTAIERHDRREARHEVNKEHRTLRRERRHIANSSHVERPHFRRHHRRHHRS